MTRSDDDAPEDEGEGEGEASRALALRGPEGSEGRYVIDLDEQGALPARAILELARKHLGMRGSIHYTPSIPRAKEEGARLAHEVHLPPDEPILALYDDTLFGGAKDGFLVTPTALYWKNFLEHPRRIAWADLDPASISVETGKVHAEGGTINVTAELVARVAAFFTEMAWRSRRPVNNSPYRDRAALARIRVGVDGRGGALPFDFVLATARATVGEVEDVYYHSSIPHAKEARARAAHAAHLPEDETLALLYDDTVFGSAEEGFVITTRRVCWKNFAEAPGFALFGELDPAAVTPRGRVVRVGDGSIQFTARGELVPAVGALLRALAEQAQQRED